MKSFIYIPSFDTSVASIAGKKNWKTKDGFPWRFWSAEFPEFYRHKYFLVTAGHHFKEKSYSVRYDFPEDMFVLGDSGGYQFASGAVDWDKKYLPVIFEWLEENSKVAVNLDIPPRKVYDGKFSECLDISFENFKYFAERQTGKVKFLNVLHGSTYDRYLKWYNQVKGMPFNGWACGGSIGKLQSMMDWLIILLENKEFEKPQTEYVHMLGASSVLDFLVLAQFQKSLDEIGSRTTITTDSSTPSRSTTYGSYYTGFDFKNLGFRLVNAPRYKETMNLQINYLPILNQVDKEIWKHFDLKTFLEFKSESYGWMVLHNFTVFFDCYKQAIDLIYSDYGILEDSVSSDTYKLLKVIDSIIKSDTPRKLYLQHTKIFEKLSRTSHEFGTDKSNNFF